MLRPLSLTLLVLALCGVVVLAQMTADLNRRTEELLVRMRHTSARLELIERFFDSVGVAR